MLGVGYAPDDEGHVGIVADEVDEDFLANARYLNGAVLVSHPRGGGSHPAGGLFVRGVVAVPVKFDFDAAVGVGPEFLFGRFDDGGCLESRLGFGDGFGANGLGVGLDDEVGVYVESLFGSAFCWVFGDVECVPENEPVAVGGFCRVIGQGEGVSGLYAAQVACGVDSLLVLLQGVKADLGFVLPLFGVRVVALLPVVDFECVVFGLLADSGVALRTFELVVRQHDLTGGHTLVWVEAVDVFFLELELRRVDAEGVVGGRGERLIRA